MTFGADSNNPRNSFLRSVGMLVSGAVLAHAITALAMPVLSRLYSPADFSALAVFASILSIIGVAAGLRFDVAVPIPDSDADAVNVLGLSLLCAGAVAALLAVPVLWMPERVAGWLGQPVLAPLLWMLPLGVFLVVGYSALQSWFVRRKAFGLIARTRIVQSAASTGTQIGLGLASIAPFGLLLGYVLNSGAACFSLGARWLWSERSTLRHLTWSGMRAMAVEYHRFPKYSTLEALSNSAAIQLPIIIIAATAAGPEAGYIALAMYAMQAPMALVGTAIGQVYLSRAPEEYRAGRLGSFTAEIFGGLLKAGVGPLLFAGIVSPVAFAFVFGEEWRRAGDLVTWMTPWFIMQFIASPISMSLLVTGRQRTALLLQLFGLVIRVATVAIFAAVNNSWVSEAYAISGCLTYLAYAAVILMVLSIEMKQVIFYASKSVRHIMSWIAGGIFVRVTFELVSVALLAHSA